MNKYDFRFWELVTTTQESENAWLNLFQIKEQFQTGDEVAEMSACLVMLAGFALTLAFTLRHHL